MSTSFDRAYYDRFYRNPRTRVTDPGDTEVLCRLVLAYMDFLGLEPTQVVDVGCGLGYWRDALAEQRPDAEYTGLEVSEYLCEEYGWQLASIADYRPADTFDLVVCQGVLQYLNNRDAAAALDNLTACCRGVLYLEALTTEDWEKNVDQDRTDGDVHLRRVQWYRTRLKEHFHNIGAGVFVRRDAPIVLFALEEL